MISGTQKEDIPKWGKWKQERCLTTVTAPLDNWWSTPWDLLKTVMRCSADFSAWVWNAHTFIHKLLPFVGQRWLFTLACLHLQAVHVSVQWILWGSAQQVWKSLGQSLSHSCWAKQFWRLYRTGHNSQKGREWLRRFEMAQRGSLILSYRHELSKYNLSLFQDYNSAMTLCKSVNDTNSDPCPSWSPGHGLYPSPFPSLLTNLAGASCLLRAMSQTWPLTERSDPLHTFLRS